MDESGDTGLKLGQGSSEWMIVIMVIFVDNEAAQTADQRIVQLRTDLKKSERFEFHFKENSDQIREAFLKAMATMDFVYTGTIVHKSRLLADGYNFQTFYRDMCGEVFENARPLLRDAVVKIDRTGGQGFRRELTAFLKRKLNEEPSEIRPVRQVTMQTSQSDNLLQLADMVCGAVARHYRGDRDKADRFYKIIAHREVSVRFWPE